MAPPTIGNEAASSVARARAVASVLLLLLGSPSAAHAAYTSVVKGSTASMTGNSASDRLAITQWGGWFLHNRSPYGEGDPGFNSEFDFDSGVAGDQRVPSATGSIYIMAGDGDDRIVLGDGIALRGTIDGGAGTDTLDYGMYTTPITANLGLGTTGLSATLGADEEVPATTSTAFGTVNIANYSAVTHTFDISVTVAGLTPAGVTGIHLHRAPVGVNGPIIVNLGALAPMVPVGNGFTLTATGVLLPFLDEAAWLAGATYVNIHTASLPGGAIRGQIFSSANSSLASGAATGTAGVINLENVTGGASGDSLVGNNASNTISGGGGADWIVAGPGSDILNGGAGTDVLAWSNGDGSDVDEGGTDSDTLQVNGSITAGDVFTVSANGARIAVSRANLSPIALDIGAVETLIVNGIGGQDQFTVNDLTGAGLTTLSLNGFRGVDIFDYNTASAGAIAFNAHGGTGDWGDAVYGPDSASSWTVTGPERGNIAGLVNFSFIETLVGGRANDTFTVRAFPNASLEMSGGGSTDTLIYDAESRAVSGDTTPPDGVVFSPGVLQVSFIDIETVTIINPQPAIAIGDVTSAEGGGFPFVVSLTNPSLLTVTVDVATANGTATAPADYLSHGGTLTFAPGQTSTIVVVQSNHDTTLENTETFVVTLANPSNATILDGQGHGSIVDDDGLSFTDPSLTPGVTTIKAAHITELRTRINAVRVAKGLPVFSFSDSPLSAGVTPIRALHVLELRTALAEAYWKAGTPPPPMWNPVAPGVLVTATAITELRAALVAIE